LKPKHQAAIWGGIETSMSLANLITLNMYVQKGDYFWHGIVAFCLLVFLAALAGSHFFKAFGKED